MLRFFFPKPKPRSEKTERWRELGYARHQMYPEGEELRPEFLLLGRTSLALPVDARIAFLGPCYARELKERMRASGYHVVQTEQNAWARHGSAGWERVFSSANAWQQLRDIARGEVAPHRLHWFRGKARDVFRYKVSYDSLSQAQYDLPEHLAAGARAIREANVFLWVVSRSEVWQDTRRNFFYSQPPPPELCPPTELATLTLDTSENKRYLEEGCRFLLEVNPSLRIVLALNPLPQFHTIGERNVIEQSVLGKASLRIAIEDVCRAMPEKVRYFPAFEALFASRSYSFDDDNYHLSEQALRTARNLFEHFLFGSSQRRPV